MMTVERIAEIREAVDSKFLRWQFEHGEAHATLQKFVHELLRDNDELRTKLPPQEPQPQKGR